PATTQPIAQSQIALGNVTVSIVAHLTADGHPTISAFFEEPGDLPGNGMLDIRHTAALGPVDVYLNTGINGALFKVYSGLTNGGNLQLLEPAGDYQVVITPAGASPDAAPLKGTFTVVSDKYLNVYAIGDPNAGTLGVVTQSFEIPALSF
ncbi:MAG TPA: hypothetical protein VKX46_05670, partial [Ktedonobacteraceae bacterium]|nr:hypothetical protein [Ktedonobacteraceae bacterium]